MGYKKQIPPKMEEVEVAPDGGWGWFVVLGAHIIQALGFGVVDSLSIFFITWREEFGLDATQTSFVISMGPLVAAIVTPITGALTVKYGARPIIIIGGLFLTSGYLICFFAESFMVLFLAIAVTTSIGVGFSFGPSLIMITIYFKERYARANGLAFAGQSIGPLVIPMLIAFLTDTYGWRGSVLVLAAIEANVLLSGALMRPLIPKLVRKKVGESVQTEEGKNSSTEIELEVFPYDKPADYLIEDENSEHEEDEEDEGEHHFGNTRMVQREFSEEMLKKLKDLSEETKAETRSLAEEPTVSTAYRIAARLLLGCRSGIRFVKLSFGISSGVLGRWKFLVLIPGYLLNGFGYYATVAHSLPRAESVLDKDEPIVLVLTMMGVGNLIGRLSHGFLVDKKVVSAETLFNIFLGICSVVTFLTPLALEFWELCLMGVIHGFSAGTVAPLMYVVVKDAVKPKDAPAAVSLVVFFVCTGNMLGGISAGKLFDVTGNYDLSFYLAGSTLLIATVYLFVVFRIQNRLRARKRRIADSKKDNPVSFENPIQLEADDINRQPSIVEGGLDMQGIVNPIMIVDETSLSSQGIDTVRGSYMEFGLEPQGIDNPVEVVVEVVGTPTMSRFLQPIDERRDSEDAATKKFESGIKESVDKQSCGTVENGVPVQMQGIENPSIVDDETSSENDSVGQKTTVDSTGENSISDTNKELLSERIDTQETNNGHLIKGENDKLRRVVDKMPLEEILETNSIEMAKSNDTEKNMVSDENGVDTDSVTFTGSDLEIPGVENATPITEETFM